MRQTFDSSVPLMEQRLRVANAKEPGRKHQKRKGAKALEAAKARARRRVKLNSARHRKYKEAVRAYWLGQSDSHPVKPRRA
jgi:hypothetical protein